jgi:hypothetical protein
LIARLAPSPLRGWEEPHLSKLYRRRVRTARPQTTQ